MSGRATTGRPPVALVTGAGSGIGERVAHLLAGRGHRVAVLDVRRDRAAAVADAIGPAAHPFAADLRDADAVSAAVAEVVRRLGPVDVLVNNAAVADPLLPTAEQELAAWQDVLDVNLRGVYLCCRAVGPDMVRRGTGAIVNVASVVGLRGGARRTAYGPSKAAVVNLSAALAAEWAPAGVRVNAIAPGYVRTPLLQGLLDAGTVDLATLRRRIPLGRLAEVDAVAEAVAFLASPAASYVTGATLVADGGLTSTLGLEPDA